MVVQISLTLQGQDLQDVAGASQDALTAALQAALLQPASQVVITGYSLGESRSRVSSYSPTFQQPQSVPRAAA